MIGVCLGALILGLVLLSGDDSDDGQVTNGGGEGNGGGSATPTATFVSELPETDETVDPEVTPPAEIEITSPPPGFVAAAPLSTETECQIRTSAAVLNWEPASPGGEQYVDLVSDFEDFVPGHYKTSQVLSADVDSLTWPGLIPGVLYFWRVTTRIDSKWLAGQSAQFVAAGCEPIDQA